MDLRKNQKSNIKKQNDKYSWGVLPKSIMQNILTKKVIANSSSLLVFREVLSRDCFASLAMTLFAKTSIRIIKDLSAKARWSRGRLFRWSIFLTH
jgi:hypothetical protein